MIGIQSLQMLVLFLEFECFSRYSLVSLGWDREILQSTTWFILDYKQVRGNKHGLELLRFFLHWGSWQSVHVLQLHHYLANHTQPWKIKAHILFLCSFIGKASVRVLLFRCPYIVAWEWSCKSSTMVQDPRWITHTIGSWCWLLVRHLSQVIY